MVDEIDSRRDAGRRKEIERAREIWSRCLSRMRYGGAFATYQPRHLLEWSYKASNRAAFASRRGRKIRSFVRYLRGEKEDGSCSIRDSGLRGYSLLSSVEISSADECVPKEWFMELSWSAALGWPRPRGKLTAGKRELVMVMRRCTDISRLKPSYQTSTTTAFVTHILIQVNRWSSTYFGHTLQWSWDRVFPTHQLL